MTTEIKLLNGQKITLNGSSEIPAKFSCDGLLIEDFGNLLHIVGTGNLLRVFSNAYKFMNSQNEDSENKSTASYRRKATLFPRQIENAVGVYPGEIERVVFTPIKG